MDLMSFGKTLVLLTAVSLSLSTAFASKKEVEGASLIERAKQLSDIRAEGLSPFRLKLSFKVTTKKNGAALQGIYTETWASQTQWRRDTIIADSHRIEVAAGQQRWLVESSQPLPETARNLPALLALGRLQPEVWKPERIEKRKLNGASLRCIEAEPEVRAGLRIAAVQQTEIPSEAPMLCFDASSGLLAAEIEPQPDTYEQYTSSNPPLVLCCKRSSHTSSCFFSDYQKFGERAVARSYHCIEDGHPILDGIVTELVTEANFDLSLFAVVEAVKERTGCPDSIRRPELSFSRNQSIQAVQGWLRLP